MQLVKRSYQEFLDFETPMHTMSYLETWPVNIVEEWMESHVSEQESTGNRVSEAACRLAFISIDLSVPEHGLSHISHNLPTLTCVQHHRTWCVIEAAIQHFTCYII